MDRKQILITVAIVLGVLILDWKTGMVRKLFAKIPVLGPKLAA